MAVSSEDVADLLEMLRMNLWDVEQKIAEDEEKDAKLKIKLIRQGDQMESLVQMVHTQKKLLNQYMKDIDAAEDGMRAIDGASKSLAAALQTSSADNASGTAAVPGHSDED